MDPTGEPTKNNLLLILVGVSLRAERHDRPLAYRLREQILRWRDACVEAEEVDLADTLEPLVCSDVWYLNSSDLHAAPAIAIGDPDVNAATAYLASRLPVAFAIDGTLQVQLDPELVDLRVCVWGATGAATARGVDLFTERYLDSFLRSAHDLPIADS